jgi:hypothetical protein
MNSFNVFYDFDNYKKILLLNIKLKKEKNTIDYFNNIDINKILNIINSINNKKMYFNYDYYLLNNDYLSLESKLIYKSNNIYSNNVIDYNIIYYFLEKYDLNKFLLNFNDMINEYSYKYTDEFKYILIFILLFYSNKIDTYSDIIKNIHKELFYQDNFFNILLKDYSYNIFNNDIFYDSLNNNISKYFILINFKKDKAFIDNYFNSLNKYIINDNKLTKSNINIIIFNNLKIKYNYTSDILNNGINLDKISKLLINIENSELYSISIEILSRKLNDLQNIKKYLNNIKKNIGNNPEIYKKFKIILSKYKVLYQKILDKNSILINNNKNIIYKNNKYETSFFLEDYPDILWYSDRLNILGNDYFIIKESSNNIINLWRYNLKNGYIVNKDNKIYIFLLINNNFIDLYNKIDKYWTDKNINFRDLPINSEYYLIELHHTLLYPLINDDIYDKNEKLIILFLSLLIAKNDILPLFFYNMINIDFTNRHDNRFYNNIYDFFSYVIIHKSIDSPFKLLYMKKYKIINEKDDDFIRRKEYFKYVNIDYKDDYKIEISPRIKKVLQNINNNIHLNNLNKIKDLDIQYNNIFDTLFVNDYIVSLDYVYLKNYNTFYNLIYKLYINEILDNNNINVKTKLINRIYNDIYSLDLPRSNADILFEIHSKIFINNKQKDFIEYIDDKDNEVQQLLMGFGKTSVITPLIILKYYLQKKYSKFIVVLPDYLVNQSYNILNSFMNLTNDFDTDYNTLNSIENEEYNINYKSNNKICIVSDVNIKKNILNRIIETETNEYIIDKQNTFFIFDEIDSLINPLKSDLNIPSNIIVHPYSNVILDKCMEEHKKYLYKKINKINNNNNKNFVEIKSLLNNENTYNKSKFNYIETNNPNKHWNNLSYIQWLNNNQSIIKVNSNNEELIEESITTNKDVQNFGLMINNRTLNKQEIDKKYRSLMLKYHPNKHINKSENEKIKLSKVYHAIQLKYNKYKNLINTSINKNLINTSINKNLINTSINKNLNNNNLNKNINNNLNDKLNNKIIYIIKKLDILKYNKDYGFGNNIDCSDNQEFYNKNHYTAIPYNYINNPVDCSEFSDYEFSLIFTLNSYIENGKLRLSDIRFINYIFKKAITISLLYLELKYNKLINLINNKSIIDNILNIDDSFEDFKKIVNIINKLPNIIDIIYCYFECIVYPLFFKISNTQYNISMIDILGSSFVNHKITFSGTVDFNLPYKIISSITEKSNKIEESKKYCLNKIKEDDSTEYIFNAFFGVNKELKPLVIYNKIRNLYEDVEKSLIKYLFEKNNILKYDSLIDVGGFFIKKTVIEIVSNIYESFKGIKNIIYLNDNDEKMIYNGEENKYNGEINNIFIYYDNKHTIGIDFKQPYNMLGLITINYTNTLTEVSQGIFRLRNINSGHNINYFYNDNVNSENIKLKYIYNKLIENGKKRKLITKNKMGYQCIKYLDRTINKTRKNYEEYIYYDLYNQLNININTYNEFIDYYVKKISKSIGINIKPILIENNYNDTNVNINIDIDLDIIIDKNNIIEKSLYVYNISNNEFKMNDYFIIESFKDSVILKINNKIITDYREKYPYSNVYPTFNDIFNFNINQKNIKNVLIEKYPNNPRLQNGKNNYVKYIKSLNSNNIYKKINNIIIDGNIYNISPFMLKEMHFSEKYKMRLYSLLIYEDVRLLLSSIETYFIISNLLSIKKEYNNICIYDIFGDLIYGKGSFSLSDSEKLILFNIPFNIENTLKILFNNKQNLYENLELIEFIRGKYYFNIKALENNTLINGTINYYELFNLDENKIDDNLKETLMNKIILINKLNHNTLPINI